MFLFAPGVRRENNILKQNFNSLFSLKEINVTKLMILLKKPFVEALNQYFEDALIFDIKF